MTLSCCMDFSVHKRNKSSFSDLVLGGNVSDFVKFCPFCGKRIQEPDLKVYGGTFRLRGVEGQHRVIVAAPNVNTVAALLGTTTYQINRYFSVTDDKQEVDIAMFTPGTVFHRSHRGNSTNKTFAIYSEKKEKSQT